MRVRRRQFSDSYVRPLVTEATRLGLGQRELLSLVRDELAELTAATRTPAGSAS